MNQKINTTLIALVVLLYFISAIGVYADDRSSDPKKELVIHFKSTTLEIDDKTIDDIFGKLDQEKSYVIQGYACSSGDKNKKYLLEEAEKKAEIVRESFIKKGFSSNKLSIIAYDYSSKCKVIIKAID